MKNVKILKEEQKELANKIRETRKNFKGEQRKESLFYKNDGVDFITIYPWSSGKSWYKAEKRAYHFQDDLEKLKFEFRHRHIAYCLLRGRKYEDIEKPAENNQPNQEYIQKVIEEYKSENVCVGS